MTTHERVVFDTNTLISAVLLPHSMPRRAVDSAVTRGLILYSADTIHELEHVLRRPKFDRYTALESRLRFLTAFIRDGELVHVTDVITDCRDPKDNMFLELAVSGAARYIVSGDGDLLDLHPFRNIAIMNAHDFVHRP